MKIVYSLLLTLTLSCAFSSAQEKQKVVTFKKERTGTDQLNYLISFPEGYDRDTTKKWPLVIFLHGAGERGSNIEVVKMHGPPMLIEKGKKLPFILISPQCPAESWWAYEPLMALIEDVEAQHRVDEKRSILTGLSMGGYGTWDLAIRYPKKFAAIVPICGGGVPYLTSRIAHTPVWVFHGGKDGVVPISESQRMVDGLKKHGSTIVKFTIYPEAGHNSWTEAYNTDALFQWMMKQKLP